MNKIVALLAIAALLLTSGCGDIAKALTEKDRLRMETARQEAKEAQARALEAQAEADKVKNEWDGRAFFVGILGTTGMPYYFGTLLFLAGMSVFYLAAFGRLPDRGGEK